MTIDFRRPRLNQNLRGLTGIVAAAAYWFIAACGTASGQPTAGNVSSGQVYNFMERRSGFQLYNVNFFSTYTYSEFRPAAVGSPVQSRPWTGQGGIGGSLGYVKTTGKNFLTFDYTGGWGKEFRYPNPDNSYHTANFGFSAAFAPRWTYSLRLNGNVRDFQSYLLAPGALSNVVAAGTNIDTLAGNLSGSSAPSDPSAAQGVGSASLNSPANFFLYGSRFFSASLNNSLYFSASPRTSYYFTFGLDRTQVLSQQTLTGQSAPQSALSYTMSGTGGVGIGYQISPRTSLNVNANVFRSYSTLFDSYFTTLNVSLGRQLRRWWYLQFNAGGGYTIPVRQTGSVSTQPRVIGGLSTAFQGYSQTLIISANTTIFDPYAIGAGRTFMTSASWAWHIPRSRWSVFAAFDDSFSQGATAGSFNTWRASGGTSTVLTNHLFLSLSGGYTTYQNTAGAAATFFNQGFSGVSASLTWTPSTLKW